MAAIWYMYGSGWVKIVDGLPAGPYDEPCKGLCFLSSFFSLVMSWTISSSMLTKLSWSLIRAALSLLDAFKSLI